MYEKGHILIGGWEIDGTLGEGSYGVVYRAKRTVANKTEWAAIKHISVPSNAAELNAIYAELGTRDVNQVNEYLSTVKDDLVSEYHQMREFQGHTNIVACNDISIIDRKDSPGYDIYIRMELLTSLSNQIMDGKMNRTQTIHLGLDVCRALMLLSSKGIVHRDIKPQNIFVNDQGDYKLGDFGTARSISGTSTMMSMKGTYAYMAPEIMLGKSANFTTDIYSLGLVMYRLMNGHKAPFMQPGQASTATSIDAANTRRFRGEELPLPAEADETLGKIICKACAFESWNRWQSAEEMYNALSEMMNGTVHREVPVVFYNEKPRVELDAEKKQLEQERKEVAAQEHEVSKRAQKRKGMKVFGIVAACALVLVAGFFGIQEINRSSTYEAAVQALNDNDLEKAKAAFSKLGEYKDSADKVVEIDKEQEKRTKYLEAEKLLKQEKYLDAVAIYAALGDYQDSLEKQRQAEMAITENERKEQYSQAEKLEAEGKYEEAITIYTALGEYSNASYKCADLQAKIENYKTAQLRESMEEYETAEDYYAAAEKYKDAETKAKEMKNWQLYVEAQGHVDNGEYKKAIAIYEQLSNEQFENTAELLKSARNKQEKANATPTPIKTPAPELTAYAEAEALLAQGKEMEAQQAFLKAVPYKDSLKRAYSIRRSKLSADNIACGFGWTLGLRTDGTVLATGSNGYGQCNVSDWTDIVAVAATHTTSYGLKADGTVSETPYHGRVACWTDIVAISAGYDHIVGLKSDGTVITAGNDDGHGVHGWKNVVAVSAGLHFTVGLKADGTVLFTGTNNPGGGSVYLNVSGWENIVEIYAGGYHILGIKSDGTVISTGDPESIPGKDEWKNIISVSAGYSWSAAITSHGTVVTRIYPDSRGYADNVNTWKDVIGIASGYDQLIGLNADGTLFATGANDKGQCSIENWDLSP